ncbi:MAG: hypothetical protein AABZ27_07740, partial [Candidatus Omnitrophota bacterium]
CPEEYFDYNPNSALVKAFCVIYNRKIGTHPIFHLLSQLVKMGCVPIFNLKKNNENLYRD